MDRGLKNISANNDLDFYYNAENIPDQDLVFGTLEYFETGPRKGFFKPLEFMNLLWKQYNFVNTNIQKAFSTIVELQALPLNSEQKHILFGFILKWFGGYPVENLNKQYNTTLRLIEKEFLSYDRETPEKEFCQRDWVKYQRTKQIEKIINEKTAASTSGLAPHQIETESKPEPLPEKNLTFKPEAIEIICDILKGFFSIEHQKEFQFILETGGIAERHLVFKSNGNRLADAFKQLIEHDFIPGCEKKDLQYWIVRNFKFVNRKKISPSPFTEDYIEKCISRKYYPCKRPLFKIEEGQISRI